MIISKSQLLRAIEFNHPIGFCTNCGVKHFDTNLEAQDKKCNICHHNTVFGAKELLLRIDHPLCFQPKE